jgi:uncharacterized protein with NRDE domain
VCLIAFAINASAQWPLVIASNRDEYLERPTLPLSRWQGVLGQVIVSGRDVRGGGTWFGFTPDGRIAFLTNVRERPEAPMPAAPRSRGELVMRWLEGRMNASQYMAQTDSASYCGFNLVLGDWQANSWTWLSNRTFDAKGAALRTPHRTGWLSRSLPAGVYGLSNAGLDSPWPKTIALKESLATALRAADKAAGAAELQSPLWQALASRSPARDEDLPDTGMSPAMERPLSSAFVDAPERAYGTVSSTLLLVKREPGSSGEGRWAVQATEKTPVRTTAPTALSPRPGVTGDCSVVNESMQWAAPAEHAPGAKTAKDAADKPD